jgi:hypothetical protein
MTSSTKACQASTVSKSLLPRSRKAQGAGLHLTALTDSMPLQAEDAGAFVRAMRDDERYLLMRYVDTSLLTAALTHEACTPRAQAWLASGDGAPTWVSDWTVAEVSPALSIKVRTGQLTLDHCAAALAMFHKLLATSFDVAGVTGAHFRTAAGFTDRHELALRAGDGSRCARSPGMNGFSSSSTSGDGGERRRSGPRVDRGQITPGERAPRPQIAPPTK